MLPGGRPESNSRVATNKVNNLRAFAGSISPVLYGQALRWQSNARDQIWYLIVFYTEDWWAWKRLEEPETLLSDVGEGFVLLMCRSTLRQSIDAACMNLRLVQMLESKRITFALVRQESWFDLSFGRDSGSTIATGLNA